MQLLDLGQDEDDEDGAIMDEEDQRKNKTAVVKTSTRQVSQPFPLSDSRNAL